MIAEIPFVILIAGAIVVGLYLANYFYDRQVEQYISRKVGHGVGGMGFLLSAFLFKEPWWPLILSLSFVILLGGARWLNPSAFRGVGGTGRQHALAEVFFPVAGTISVGVGWVWLGDRWLAVVPILFMAWGDMLTGLIRSRFYGREVKGNWGSVGMLGVSLLVAYLFTPYWIGAAGAVSATAIERFTPLSRGIWDDNWTIVLGSLMVMALLGGARYRWGFLGG